MYEEEMRRGTTRGREVAGLMAGGEKLERTGNETIDVLFFLLYSQFCYALSDVALGYVSCGSLFGRRTGERFRRDENSMRNNSHSRSCYEEQGRRSRWETGGMRWETSGRQVGRRMEDGLGEQGGDEWKIGRGVERGNGWCFR